MDDPVAWCPAEDQLRSIRSAPPYMGRMALEGLDFLTNIGEHSNLEEFNSSLNS